jgi:hypothetical protein
VLLLAAALVLAIPIAFMPGDWAAWLALYATFALPAMFLSFRRNPRLILAIWLTLIAHHAIAIINAYFGPVFGASDDAEGFHLVASAIAATGDFTLSLGSRFYSTMLAVAYSLCGSSHFLGEETSILAYSLSTVVLVRLMDLLKIERHRIACVLVYGLLPSAILYRSITVRESWEMLFFMSSVYGMLRFRTTARPGALLLGAASALLMGFLHNGLMMFAVLLIPYALVARLGIRSSLSLQRLLGLGLTAVVMAGLTGAVLTGRFKTESMEHVAEGKALDYAAKYRKNSAVDARAAYDAKLDTDSPAAFAASLPLVYFSYMMSPMPWKISTGLDVYGALDAWLRVLLLAFAIRAWRSPAAKASSYMVGFLISLYFMMSLLFSLGTINYGTALRHHIVPLWIIVLLGVPPLIDRLAALSRVRLKA